MSERRNRLKTDTGAGSRQAPPRKTGAEKPFGGRCRALRAARRMRRRLGQRLSVKNRGTDFLKLIYFRPESGEMEPDGAGTERLTVLLSIQNRYIRTEAGRRGEGRYAALEFGSGIGRGGRAHRYVRRALKAAAEAAKRENGPARLDKGPDPCSSRIRYASLSGPGGRNAEAGVPAFSFHRLRAYETKNALRGSHRAGVEGGALRSSAGEGLGRWDSFLSHRELRAYETKNALHGSYYGGVEEGALSPSAGEGFGTRDSFLVHRELRAYEIKNALRGSHRVGVKEGALRPSAGVGFGRRGSFFEYRRAVSGRVRTYTARGIKRYPGAASGGTDGMKSIRMYRGEIAGDRKKRSGLAAESRVRSVCTSDSRGKRREPIVKQGVQIAGRELRTRGGEQALPGGSAGPRGPRKVKRIPRRTGELPPPADIRRVELTPGNKGRQRPGSAIIGSSVPGAESARREKRTPRKERLRESKKIEEPRLPGKGKREYRKEEIREVQSALEAESTRREKRAKRTPREERFRESKKAEEPRFPGKGKKEYRKEEIREPQSGPEAESAGREKRAVGEKKPWKHMERRPPGNLAEKEELSAGKAGFGRTGLRFVLIKAKKGYVHAALGAARPRMQVRRLRVRRLRAGGTLPLAGGRLRLRLNLNKTGATGPQYRMFRTALRHDPHAGRSGLSIPAHPRENGTSARAGSVYGDEERLRKKERGVRSARAEKRKRKATGTAGAEIGKGAGEERRTPRSIPEWAGADRRALLKLKIRTAASSGQNIKFQKAEKEEGGGHAEGSRQYRPRLGLNKTEATGSKDRLVRFASRSVPHSYRLSGQMPAHPAWRTYRSYPSVEASAGDFQINGYPGPRAEWPQPEAGAFYEGNIRVSAAGRHRPRLGLSKTEATGSKGRLLRSASRRGLHSYRLSGQMPAHPARRTYRSYPSVEALARVFQVNSYAGPRAEWPRPEAGVVLDNRGTAVKKRPEKRHTGFDIRKERGAGTELGGKAGRETRVWMQRTAAVSSAGRKTDADAALRRLKKSSGPGGTLHIRIGAERMQTSLGMNLWETGRRGWGRTEPAGQEEGDSAEKSVKRKTAGSAANSAADNAENSAVNSAADSAADSAANSATNRAEVRRFETAERERTRTLFGKNRRSVRKQSGDTPVYEILRPSGEEGKKRGPAERLLLRSSLGAGGQAGRSSGIAARLLAEAHPKKEKHREGPGRAGTEDTADTVGPRLAMRQSGRKRAENSGMQRSESGRTEPAAFGEGAQRRFAGRPALLGLLGGINEKTLTGNKEPEGFRRRNRVMRFCEKPALRSGGLAKGQLEKAVRRAERAALRETGTAAVQKTEGASRAGGEPSATGALSAKRTGRRETFPAHAEGSEETAKEGRPAARLRREPGGGAPREAAGGQSGRGLLPERTEAPLQLIYKKERRSSEHGAQSSAGGGRPGAGSGGAGNDLRADKTEWLQRLYAGLDGAKPRSAEESLHGTAREEKETYIWDAEENGAWGQKEMEKLIRKCIRGQMSMLGSRMYTEVERRLLSEKRRRGL